ncbi:MAG: sugar ABC transporter ATP-binding protein [Cyanobium sp. NAT70]|nr:sugar ABC transporter ATP-binding protein [Cyanobium sp. NAT70]
MTLELRSIGRRFGDRWILQDMNLTVQEGECLALLGASGCGKSTALRLIAGLDQPDIGEIFIDGHSMDGIPARERRIGMVFQSYALFPHLTIRNNLELGLRLRGATTKARYERINMMLEIVQLTAQAEQRPSQLSGGQRQRVALARALLRDPLIYLLDEPMSNLDAQLREELRPELKRLILDGTKPVIYVTHDQQEAMALADRIAVMRHGRIEQIGTPRELYQYPATTYVAQFIGRPPMNMLDIEEDILIGVRPEDLFFKPDGLNCRLLNQEWQGATQQLLLDTEYGHLKMICDGDTSLSEDLRVSWRQDREHRFERKTGQRL